MQTVFFVSLCITTLLLGAQLWLRPLLVSKIRFFFWASIAVIGGLLLRASHIFFITGVHSPDLQTRFFFPPYQDASFLLLKLWNQFWLPYVLSFLVATIFLLCIRFTKKSWVALRFERHEPYLIALGIFLTGHPFWVLYFFLTAFFYLGYTLGIRILSKKNLRVSFVHFWLPAALLTLAVTPFLKDIWLLRQLSVFTLF